MSIVNVFLLGSDKHSLTKIGELNKSIIQQFHGPTEFSSLMTKKTCFSVKEQSLKTNVETVDKFNEFVLNFISQVKNGNYNISGSYITTFEHQDLKCKFLKVMRYRRCSAFFFLQQSSKQFRLLCYVEDEISHNGQGFGTNMECFIEYDLENSIRLIQSDNHIQNISIFGV